MTLLRRSQWVVCALLAAYAGLASAQPVAEHGERSVRLSYQAKVGWLGAGDLDLQLHFAPKENEPAGYEVDGYFATHPRFARYYRWQGHFGAKGVLAGQQPQTSAYIANARGKDSPLKVTILYAGEARRMKDPEQGFQTIEFPGGTDLISAMFVSPDCYAGNFVHDGEDQYRITLKARKSVNVSMSPPFYSGPAVRCEYHVWDNRDRRRAITVVRASIDGIETAVSLRVRLRFLPDILFRLRVRQAPEEDVAEGQSDWRSCHLTRRPMTSQKTSQKTSTNAHKQRL